MSCRKYASDMLVKNVGRVLASGQPCLLLGKLGTSRKTNMGARKTVV